MQDNRMIKVLKSKLHRATITEADLHYEGSITISTDLMELVGIRRYEAVCIFDIDNGNRFETYTIEGAPGEGIICVNGAAARLVSAGDKIIIAAFNWLPESAYAQYKPRIVLLGDDNIPVG